jgi:hypothetical protein
MPLAPSLFELPDPLLSANLYCESLLDELIQGAVVPFWNEVRRRDPERRARLWLVRYARGGEHLKLRLHGPAELGPEMRELLTAATESYLASLGPPGPEREGRERLDVPPIDEEDQTDHAHPDRTLLWTHYRRSHVSLPAKPYLLDDEFVALFTACLGEAGERALDALANAGSPVTTQARQTALLKGLISGLGALGFQPAEGASYLAYHRDWLIRFTLQRNGADPGKARETLAYFDTQVSKMKPAIDRLRGAVQAAWTGASQPGSTDPWRSALAGLMTWVSARRGDPAYHIDPYAQDPVFAPFFKVFHGFANALGLTALDEGFTHHMLLQAAGGAATSSLSTVAEGASVG